MLMVKQALPLFPSLDRPSLQKSEELLRIFEDVHNHMYANDGLSPEQALEEVIKILFLKIFDEKYKKYGFKITPTEYDNAVGGKSATEFTRRFSELQKNTFSFFSNLFEKDEKIRLRESTLAFAVNKLQHIDLLSSSNDVKGLAFQKFIRASQRIGRGQFFTPEQVIKLCVDIIQPQAKEFVLDPACGSGGFLSSALQYVALTQRGKEDKFAREKIFGIEINQTASRIAKMRMILDGDGFSNIATCDSLSDWSDIDLGLNKANQKNVNTYQEFFDIILTNPPFGTQGKIANKSVLRNFDLGYKWNKADEGFSKSSVLLNGQVPEILFIERCLKFLKPGGRMSIVLPNGDFENSSLAYLRNYIKDVAEVFAVIKLPQETFIPSGTGVKTSILFLRKKIAGEISGRPVFFSQVTKLGYSGNKNGSIVYKKGSQGNILKDRNGVLKIDEDISDVVSAFLTFKSDKKFKDKENSFTIHSENLDYSRLDFEFYKPSYRKTEKQMLDQGALRLGELIKIKKKKSDRLKQKDLMVQYVELSDISTQYNEIIHSTEEIVHELPSRATYEIKEGEIITAVAGNSIGTNNHVSAYVTSEYDECICSNGFRVFTVDESLINPFYLLYYLKSKHFLEQVFRFRTGAAIPSLLDSDLLNILVLLPSKKEQARIGKIIQDGFKQRKEYRQLTNKIEVSVKEVATT